MTTRAHECRPTHVRLSGHEWLPQERAYLYLVVAWQIEGGNPVIILDGRALVLHVPGGAEGWEWEALDP